VDEDVSAAETARRRIWRVSAQLTAVGLGAARTGGSYHATKVDACGVDCMFDAHGLVMFGTCVAVSFHGKERGRVYVEVRGGSPSYSPEVKQRSKESDVP
jgi:hypothetical protein